MDLPELPDLATLDHAQRNALIVALHAVAVQVTALRERVAALEANSRNSSKPSSTDGLDEPTPKARRTRSGKPSGGQPGHLGSTLKRVSEPDHRIDHEPGHCASCGAALDGAELVAEHRRQVFDIPPVAVEVTEHRALTRRCACGACTAATFPDGVGAPVQYGPRLQSTVVYLAQYQLVPMARLTEALADLFGLTISQGTVNNLIRRCHDELEGFETAARDAVRAAPVAHFDESGVRVEGKLHWLHVAATATITCYLIHGKRGVEAMQAFGILPGYRGYAVHDHWGPYFHFENVLHVLCNAHHLRELVYAHEEHGQGWARWLIRALVETQREVEAAKAAGLTRLDEAAIDRIERRYRPILKKGEAELPGGPAPPAGTRGRGKCHKAANLHARLRDFESEALGFVYDFARPFDNNLAERDVRMIKVRQKVSGCFRSADGATTFARIRGYVSTAKKQGRNVMEVLSNAFAGRAFDPSAGTLAAPTRAVTRRIRWNAAKVVKRPSSAGKATAPDDAIIERAVDYCRDPSGRVLVLPDESDTIREAVRQAIAAVRAERGRAAESVRREETTREDHG